MFDFNCDVAQGYGIYKNDQEFEIAKFTSSINIAAGFHAGDPVSIKKALMFAKEHNLAIGAHIGYPDIQGFGNRKMDLAKDELIAVVTYQVCAISAYANTYNLEIEQIRTHGALKTAVNESQETAQVVGGAIKKINPWLNLIVQNSTTKELLESLGIKSALEADFSESSTIRAIRENENQIDTIHFKSLDDIKRAYDVLKPTPINYNRVQKQL